MPSLWVIERIAPLWRGAGRCLAGLLLLQCGTDAVGVEQCRTIENARCVAAAQCGLIDDAAACQRFVRDHCLHGLPLDEAPGHDASERCAEAVLRAGRCAESRGSRTEPGTCSESWFGDSSAARICQIVEQPERTRQCAFLSRDGSSSPPGSDDAGAEPERGRDNSPASADAGADASD